MIGTAQSHHLSHRTTIGVLAFGKSPREQLPPLRIRALAAEAAMQGARLVLFSSADCNLDSDSIAAEIWTPDGWISTVLPLPTVVLMVTTPIRERDHEVATWVKDRTTSVDDRGLGKLELPRRLAASALARYVIPQSELGAVDLVGTIAAWMQEHGDCVVKADGGKRGCGVQRAHRGDGETWILRRDDEALPFATAPDLAATLARRIAGRMHYRKYLIQTYIRSVSRDGRAADLRVHIQRGGEGTWHVTRTYARMGEVGYAVSNVSRGGYQGPAEGFLKTRRVRRPADLLAETEHIALGTAAVIEAANRHPLSELGVDLAIDPDDRLWVIEANTHPQSSLHEHERAIRTIGYALHLAGRHTSREAKKASTVPTNVPARSVAWREV